MDVTAMSATHFFINFFIQILLFLDSSVSWFKHKKIPVCMADQEIAPFTIQGIYDIFNLRSNRPRGVDLPWMKKSPHDWSKYRGDFLCITFSLSVNK